MHIYLNLSYANFHYYLGLYWALAHFLHRYIGTGVIKATSDIDEMAGLQTKVIRVAMENPFDAFDSADATSSEAKLGDIIEFTRKGYMHYAIHIGNGYIIIINN